MWVNIPGCYGIYVVNENHSLCISINWIATNRVPNRMNTSFLDINRSHGCSKNCGETTVATPGSTWGGREEAEFIRDIQSIKAVQS